MKTEELSYDLDDQIFEGYVAHENLQEGQKAPMVLVAHAWKGQDEFARNKAKALAKLGYIGFAVDLYGEGVEVESDAEAAALMKPLFVNRKELRRRIVAAYQAIKNHPLVDTNKMGAIGFCFGGLAVLELLRSGEELQGVATFHAVLGNQMGGLHAVVEPPQLPLHGSLLLLHGHKDPLVSEEDIMRIQNEFSDANIDWQMDIYGRAAHAFTNPYANDPESGLVYNAGAARRSWQSMENFFNECF